MCDLCLGFTRRNVLTIGTIGVAAGLLAACNGDAAVEKLPDVYNEHLGQEGGAKPIAIDRTKIVLPPPRPAEKTEYGNIMPRAAWSRLPLQVANASPMAGVRRITIHHSGDGKPFLGESIAEVATHLQIVQQAHLQRGMIDIAYHFAVDRTGRAWQLRWLNYEGQHVRPSKNGTRNNEHNVGIVALGDFNLQSPTTAQRDRLLELVRLVRTKYAVGTLAALPVSMHGEIVQTDCPGKRLITVLQAARTQRLV